MQLMGHDIFVESSFEIRMKINKPSLVWALGLLGLSSRRMRRLIFKSAAAQHRA